MEGAYAEQEMRKAFTPMERVAIGLTLEELERAKAKDRQKRKPKSIVANCPQLEKMNSRTR